MRERCVLYAGHMGVRDSECCPLTQVVPLKNANFEQLVATWEEVVNATDGGCAERGHCAIAYQGNLSTSSAST